MIKLLLFNFIFKTIMEYIYPENITSNKLSILQIKQWKEQGYILINGLLEDNILQNAINELNILYPDIRQQQNIIDDIASKQDFGSNGKLLTLLTKLLYLKILLMLLNNY